MMFTTTVFQNMEQDFETIEREVYSEKKHERSGRERKHDRREHERDRDRDRDKEKDKRGTERDFSSSGLFPIELLQYPRVQVVASTPHVQLSYKLKGLVFRVF